jgi:hypothetical protein
MLLDRVKPNFAVADAAGDVLEWTAKRPRITIARYSLRFDDDDDDWMP